MPSPRPKPTAELLIVHLDTQGGALDSVRDMVEAIFDARLPVAVFVSPTGAQAVGGGTYILAAAHIAAMAPAGNTGAVATPDVGTLESRTDIRAWLRSIAQERGRDEEALDATASLGEAYTTAEALELGVIDLIANDTDELVQLLDGRTVQVRGATVVLETAELEVTGIEKTPLEHVRGLLADPNIAFALLALGGLGLLIELASPGLVVPGALGGLSLALGLVATETLPINWVGAGLLALSAVLVYVELQTSGGLFGAAGAASFLLGGFLLFGGTTPPPIEAPSFRVNIVVIFGLALPIFGLLLFVVRDMARARRIGASPSALDALLGQTGVVSSALVPHGTVHIGGENWSAVTESGSELPEDTPVVIVDTDGLVLKVVSEADFDEEVHSYTRGVMASKTPDEENLNGNDLPEELTAREVEVLSLVARGFTNLELADELGISVSTVKRHLTNIYGKLGVSHRTEAVARAVQMKLL